ncbi:hypothetical protein B0H17DRAFT_1145811 [Mycena rosella]|uniref:SAP domain-containing protein n=1 Tax=Mycena rosella TaxID=1033263 RepID=A0AAD7CQ92_MYCRO|nr:hypothetical protein B0H17DRAFT_1145811 [Mycena rosella]
MPPSAPWVEEFTLPGLNQTLGADRLIKEVQLKIINKTTTKELQAYLGSYGLPISGPNKGVLVDRLRTYANDREQGIGRKKNIFRILHCFLLRFRLFQPRVKRSRGDLSGSRLNTHSGKRIVSQFGQIEPETEYPSKRVAAAAALTSAPWAMPSGQDQITEPRTSGGCNHTPDETLGAPPSSDGNNERLPTKISALSSQVAALSDLIQRPQHEEPRKTDIRLRRIEREIKGMKSQILGVHSGISALLATESRGESPSSTALKEARESQEKSDAAAARRFFHDNLDHPDADGAFAYTKTGQRRIKEKDSAVAEIWRELLANNAEIARRWAEVQRAHRST